MNKTRTLLLIFALLLSCFTGPVYSGNSAPVAKGGKLPVIVLPIPKNTVEKIYLGLSGSGSFKIHQIKAEAVLIKIWIVHTHLGALTEVQAFLDVMFAAYGINQNDLKKKEKLATSTSNLPSITDELK